MNAGDILVTFEGASSTYFQTTRCPNPCDTLPSYLSAETSAAQTGC